MGVKYSLPMWIARDHLRRHLGAYLGYKLLKDYLRGYLVAIKILQRAPTLSLLGRLLKTYLGKPS
jgi:hypothetical protein